MGRLALYLRVSTDRQTTDNQRRELEAWAERAGFEDVVVYEDQISGASEWRDRPGLEALLKAAARREFAMVAVWSVDRLGRSLKDLCDVLMSLHATGVGLYLHQQSLDTTTPSGRAMFQMMGVFAEFERNMIAERVRTGMARAKAQGKHIGRSPISPEQAARMREMRAAGSTKREIADDMNVSTRTVARYWKARREEP